VSSVAPRLVTILKEIHADAVDSVGELQQKRNEINLALEAHHVTVAALNMYKASIGGEDSPVLDSLLTKSASMGERLQEISKEIAENLAEMNKGLDQMTEDLRTVDPDFGKDLGPELSLVN